MPWYHYIGCFFAGAFLANVVPHFVHGISGDSFPTPFAKPPGKGLSSAPVNMVWSLVNMALGYGLFRFGGVWNGSAVALGWFFAGVAAMGLMLSIRFQTKHGQ